MSTIVDELTTADTGLEPIVLRLRPAVELTDDQLFDLCQANQELRIEYSDQGELIVMTPAGSESSSRNSELNRQVANWAKRDRKGIAFDSSGGFRLPNGAMRSPDSAWVRRERWDALGKKERERFAPLCPDLVVELRSGTDRLRTLQAKMREYLDNGAQLGLLIDPTKRQVHVYRRDRQVEVLDDPKAVPCDPELPGLTLDMQEIW